MAAKRNRLTPVERKRPLAYPGASGGFVVGGHVYKPVGLIRCVVDPPCSVCWYCEQARKR